MSTQSSLPYAILCQLFSLLNRKRTPPEGQLDFALLSKVLTRENACNINTADFVLSALHVACDVRDLDDAALIRFIILELGVDVNVTAELEHSNHVWTPLYYAAKAGNLNCVRALVEMGADMNYGRENCIPLLIAMDKKRKACVRYLIDQGARHDFMAANLFHPWVVRFINARIQTRSRSVAFLRAARKRIGHDATRLVGQWVWACRGGVNI
jgi:ankyrin repeat protein